MQPDILPYGSKEPRGGIPWGICSLTFGGVAAIGMPVFDAVTQLPGFVQSQFLSAGMASGVVGIILGVVSLFFSRERLRGIIGIGLGVFGYCFLQMIARA